MMPMHTYVPIGRTALEFEVRVSDGRDRKSVERRRRMYQDSETHGMPNEKPGIPVIGWREWVSLPDLGIDRIKAKVDSGARSSSLHAFDINIFQRGGEEWVRFKVNPVQRNNVDIVELETKLLDSRSVRSSSGKATVRPVIITTIQLLGVVWPLELTLANRDRMGFRMLLGRQAFRHRFLVDGGKSYFAGKPTKISKDRATSQDRKKPK